MQISSALHVRVTRVAYAQNERARAKKNRDEQSYEHPYIVGFRYLDGNCSITAFLKVYSNLLNKK